MAELIGTVTAWAKSEIEDCFSGIDIDLEGEFYLEEEDNSGYIKGVMVNGNGANIYGRLDVFGATAERVAMAIRIESAQSIADLPEGLSSADEDIRDLAKTSLEKLGLNTGDKTSLSEIDELLELDELKFDEE